MSQTQMQHIARQRLRALCAFLRRPEGAQALVAMRALGINLARLTHACQHALLEEEGFVPGSLLRRVACAGNRATARADRRAGGG